MKFKVGDVVTVKTWEELAAEYPVVDGNIECPGGFYRRMKPLCGKSAIVCDFSAEGNAYKLRPLGVEDMVLDWDWEFTDEMLKG